jgi:hypothetical protein
MKRKRNKYPNGYRDKIAYHREQGNDEKVKYFEEKQRQLDESKCIQVLEFLGYRVKKMSNSVILCQENPSAVSVPLSMAINKLNALEVLTKIAGKIHKVDEEELRVQFRALVDTDHNQLRKLLYEHREMHRQCFINEVWDILASEKLI